MGKEQPHVKVKLVIPVLFSDKDILEKIIIDLIEYLGEIDFRSDVLPFTFTNYYDDEMEGETFRAFLSFQKLIAIEELVDIKKNTNKLELKYDVNGKRRVNLDPGYIELGKFVLATTKDQQHRLYIRDGIFEEITLFYREKKWRHWEWTYPDYRSEEYKSILEKIREIYKSQLKLFKPIL